LIRSRQAIEVLIDCLRDEQVYRYVSVVRGQPQTTVD